MCVLSFVFGCYAAKLHFCFIHARILMQSLWTLLGGCLNKKICRGKDEISFLMQGEGNKWMGFGVVRDGVSSRME